ncbi:MAG: Methyltransferase type 11 [Parcubacteria group bacterium GW2011_GWC2_38_7]|nr:MAG: Methyltransferase type 11 [Parcubacteria group bacterium GW2011_GWC2_38_7]
MANNEQVTRKKFNFLKKYYDETWDKTGHTLHVGIFKDKADSLNQAYQNATDHLIKNINETLPINKDSVILDLGCGTGRTIIEICEKYSCAGVGIDISDEQIKDAKQFLKQLNSQRQKKNQTKLQVKFICASVSDLEKVFQKDGIFTHVISQDALLLAVKKISVFKNVFRLLKSNGVLAIADFLSESKKAVISKKEEQLVYKLVNWQEAFSYELYQQVISDVGLKMIKKERRDSDMAKTYSKLATKMIKYEKGGDATYIDLKNRYNQIVISVKVKKMGWGFFLAQKPPEKVALIAGTKSKSIGRYLGEQLQKQGYTVWLYGRHAQKIDKPGWHERKCNITNEKSISILLNEISKIDLVMMLADGGDGHRELSELSEEGIRGCVDAKLTGSLLLNKALINKYSDQENKIKLVWCAGKAGKKSKELIVYSMMNAGLEAYIVNLNEHYSDILEAYYLPTGLISPSTIGDAYIKKHNLKKGIATHPQKIVAEVYKIVKGQYKPGMCKQSHQII